MLTWEVLRGIVIDIFITLMIILLRPVLFAFSSPRSSYLLHKAQETLHLMQPTISGPPALCWWCFASQKAAWTWMSSKYIKRTGSSDQPAWYHSKISFSSDNKRHRFTFTRPWIKRTEETVSEYIKIYIYCKRELQAKRVHSSHQAHFNEQSKVQKMCITARGVPALEFHYSLSPSFEVGPEGRR